MATFFPHGDVLDKSCITLIHVIVINHPTGLSRTTGKGMLQNDVLRQLIRATEIVSSSSTSARNTLHIIHNDT